ncbi:MAG: TrmH family RNA methyltransferase [Bradymonadia bacterium]
MIPNHITVDGVDYPVDAVIDALSPHMSESRLTRFESVLGQRLKHLVLAVENLHHSHNASACLRSAEALGLQDVVAIEDLEALPLQLEAAPYPIMRKVSKTAHRWLDIHSVDGPEGLKAFADARGARLFGAGPRGALTLDSLPIDRPVIVVFGNELNGLRPETESLCDGMFRIPMYGFCESFNVSVSAGIVLQRLGERIRAEQPEALSGDLSDERRRLLMAEWCARDVKAAAQILRRKLGQ